MADNFEFLSSVYGKYLGSGEDESEESKTDSDGGDVEQKEVTLVEEKVKSAMPEPESLTLEELAVSDYIRNRQLAAKSIVEYLHQAGSNKEALHSVISIMCKLSEDEDIMVRSELMEHIPSIALFCKEHPEDLGVVIRQQIVPYTVKLLTDIQRQVRKIGHTTLLVLLENDVIDNSQLSEWICPLIAQLVTSGNTPQELRIEDVSVMCKMIPYVGKEITEKFFLEPILSLCRDTSSSAREVCMLNFGNISQVIGTEATESILLSAFLDLCQDETREIKSKCVDIAVDLASIVSPTTRHEILADVYMSFLKDDSHQIWYSSHQLLGRFISTFADSSKTGLSYSDGTWYDAPVENENIEDQQKNANYFEILTSEIISNPQLLDECSFFNLNGCLFDDCSSDEDAPQTFSSTEIKNSELNFQEMIFDSQFVSPRYKRTYFKSTLFSETVNDRKINSEISNLQNSLNSEKKLLTYPQLTSTTDNFKQLRHLCSHVDNENTFNHFQFWRTPLPEVELDIDKEESSTNINLSTREKLHSEDANSNSCATESAVISSSKQCLKEPDHVLLKTDRDIDLSKSQDVHYEECNMLVKEDSDIRLNSAEERLSTDDESPEILAVRYFQFKKQRNLLLYQKGSLSLKERFNNQVTKEKQTAEKEKIIYDQDIVPPELLMEFTNNMCHDEDTREMCAFYFPSVAYTLGRKYWSCIRDLFHLLATDMKCRVRRTIASSLHELAIILGQDITTEDLFPVFLDMLRDPNVRCHSSLRMNISQFLKKLKPHARRKFLPLIQGICTWDEESNWRYRFTVAEQFIPCVELFSSSEALHFLPVPLMLLQDKVSAVRSSAVELLAVIIKSMVVYSKSSDFLKAVLCAIDKKYRKANKWLWRQMYVYICQELAMKRSLPIDFYVNEIVPNLLSLAWDTVPNVRLAVARCLSLTLLPLEYFPSIQKAHYQLLLQVMYSLQSDVDKDVRYFAYLSAAAFNVLPPRKESHLSQFEKCEEWWVKSD